MKTRNIFFVALALLSLSFTSCRKTYSCRCLADEQVILTRIANETKGNAKEICTQMEEGAKLTDPDATCEFELAQDQQP